MNPTWQKNLKDNTQFKDLYIPGTHNSGTYLIDWEKTPLKYGWMSKHAVPFRSVFKTLVTNQTKTIEEQLEDGIRFFDLRVSKLSKEEAPNADSWKINGVEQEYSLWISHTWICQPLEQVLHKIFQYVIDNPSEFITLQVKNDWDDREDITKDEVISLVRRFTIENNYSIRQKKGYYIANDQVRILRGKVFISVVDSKWYDTSSIKELKALLKIDASKDYYQGNYNAVLTPNNNIVILTLVLLSLFFIILTILILLSFKVYGNFSIVFAKDELNYLVFLEVVLALLIISIRKYNKNLYYKGLKVGEELVVPGIVSVDFYSKKFLDERIGLNDFDTEKLI